MPLSISSQAKQLADGSPAGTQIGYLQNSAGTADSIAFFGGTPVPQILQGTLKGVNGLLNIYTTAQSPASVIANTTGERAMTVTGVISTDMVIAVIKPTAQAGLLVGTARVSATNTIQVTFGNNTAAAVTPTTTESYLVVTVPANLQYPAVTLTPASVASNSSVEQQFTVTGVQPGMIMSVTKPTVNAGVLITNVRAIAANTVGVTFTNVTAAAVTPTAGESYLFYGAQGLRAAPPMQNVTASLAPVSVAANTTAEQTFTVTGLNLGSSVIVDKPSVTAGLALAGARVSAANTLAITFANVTATAITPPAEIYSIGLFDVASAASGSVIATAVVNGVDGGSELTRNNMLG